MKEIKQRRRLLAAALTVVMTLGSLPLNGLAAVSSGGGLCEHHKSHTDACGYGNGQSGTHEHTEDCYTDELICGFIVDEDEIATASASDDTHRHTKDCYRLECPRSLGGGIQR